MRAYAVLIPAYQPDNKLVHLFASLRAENIAVIIVDDGSGVEYADIFEDVSNAGACVLYHKENRGKGAALKTGISYLKAQPHIKGIVTADADGQHTVKDICMVANAMKTHSDMIVIGARSFSGEVPMRSRIGNTITRGIFRFTTGLWMKDTQTGLRGLPRKIFERLITLEGDRYDYEMNMLLNLKKWGIDYIEVPIDTIYIQGNKSSHFHTLRDSWLIYAKILKSWCGHLMR